ncbi:thiol:disulfide interchange protein DsbA/DsbL [Photobacterium profundum]|uniref:Hypothetical thiol-disulfide isomerase n=1 Tax=Photobacterium profundum (strain SS9) TaxID=298386 RepID=Q6LFV3_PHOPR|nr:thiol:disulfide interchange protein DsbA/DsbL [Photobacterium profundum]CAG23827.1 hypothetical thiol-disulfide isomerase [Photobacterium profundum SS9]
MKTVKKKCISIAFAILSLLSAGCNSDTIAKQGIHYTILPPISYELPEVVEIFSLSCTHCRMMEEIMHSLEIKSESDIQKMHCVFNKRTSTEAYLYYSAAIQTEDQPSRLLMDQLFAFIQHDAEGLSGLQVESKIRDIFHTYNLQAPEDLTAEQFEKISELVERDRQIMKELNLGSVPAIVVNGKYLINMNEHVNLDAVALTIKELKTI